MGIGAVYLSDSMQANWCAIPSPSSWPALMQSAAPAYLARCVTCEGFVKQLMCRKVRVRSRSRTLLLSLSPPPLAA